MRTARYRRLLAHRRTTTGPDPGGVRRPHQLVGKTAYFDGNLQPTSPYPCPTSIQCTIEEIADDVATVSTWWLEGGPNDTRFVFDVPLETLTPITDT
ncbi:hypothetical protein [Streptomyces canus]|uniref:hypothetical protein n=1 Tax=Streptomyces canus TaxID=58343 RepID=UPI0027D79939|nr:hypothetical protein [Streptomyces canus]